MAKRKVYQHRFDLYADDAGDVDLHRYLLGLAGVSKASDWIRGTLKAIMIAQRAALDVPETLKLMEAERNSIATALGVSAAELVASPTPKGFRSAPYDAKYSVDAHVPRKGGILDADLDEPHYEPPEDIA